MSRSIEKLMYGQEYWKGPMIAARICGSHSISHLLSATLALENSCDIPQTVQTRKLRQLLLSSEIIREHTSRLYFSVLTEFINVENLSDFYIRNRDFFDDAETLVEFSNIIAQYIGGRETDPISCVVGGFKKLPADYQLNEIFLRLEKIEKIAERSLKLFSTMSFPKTINDFDLIAIRDNEIWSNTGDQFDIASYNTKLYKESTSNKSSVTLKGKKCLSGSLARFFLHKSGLNAQTKKTIQELHIEVEEKNIFSTVKTSAIEIYSNANLIKEIISDLISGGIKKEHVIPPRKFTAGTAAVESAGGIMIYNFELDTTGLIKKCDIITPSDINHATVESITDNKSLEKNVVNLINKTNPICSHCFDH